MMNGNPITPELEAGLKDLGFVRQSGLASAIWKSNFGESIPKPGKESEPSTLERLAKQNPLLGALAVLAMVTGVVGFIGLLVTSLLIAIAYVL